MDFDELSRNVIGRAQILMSLKLPNMPPGLLINFNVTKLQNGIKRFLFYSFALFVSFVVPK